MTPLQREFAKLVGRVLGRQWFDEQRQRAERNRNCAIEKGSASAQSHDGTPEARKKRGQKRLN